MAASTVQNPAVQTESKSAKKKKAKAAAAAAERTDSPAPTASPAPEKADGSDESGESPYVRELQKNIRNTNKKLTNASKIDGLIAENTGKSLDELVASRIINADQKAQYLKKPALQAQVQQYEEQLAQYKKIDHEYRTRAASEKAELEKAFAERLEKEKAEAVAEVKAKAEGDSSQSLTSKLLVLSQFLRLAAARRSEEADQSIDENLALEGTLLAIYAGDDSAVAAMLKLIEGTDEKTHGVAGEELNTTFGQVKLAAQAYKIALDEPAPAETEAEPATDPTVANATVNEIEAGDDIALTNGHPEQNIESHANANITSGSGNAAGEKWDQNDNTLSESQEWVSVPRDPVETETGIEATPAAASNTQSWADDQPEHHEIQQEAPAPAADPNDGFHQVQGRNRGRGDREGGSGHRGRGRGEWRGRGGFRGEGRGRGQRGQRGGSVSMRGPRRNEES
ncbi:hypothetical protein CkaCkLH20_08076 [Colletotrichum karsti]|uniref:YAG7-like dimerisation domain-containing protein n=1 Tax=Colletotrichum karsti TaxID=1095194 RepID=A0A9P6LIE1_9PEZI|nr:uncharacterized protein CkaCkLH20_08076 [Colletotrichum karsti]KAF9874513.1 hypothetical protein CkaCkLH20_08076 [Colletotrichum karsti]